MQAWSELITAVAALLWPLFAFVALFAFRSELRSLLARIKKGKVLGQEIELQESLAILEVQAQKAVSAATAVPELPTSSGDADRVAYLARDTVARISDQAARSPKA